VRGCVDLHCSMAPKSEEKEYHYALAKLRKGIEEFRREMCMAVARAEGIGVKFPAGEVRHHVEEHEEVQQAPAKVMRQPVGDCEEDLADVKLSVAAPQKEVSFAEPKKFAVYGHSDTSISKDTHSTSQFKPRASLMSRRSSVTVWGKEHAVTAVSSIEHPDRFDSTALPANGSDVFLVHEENFDADETMSSMIVNGVLNPNWSGRLVWDLLVITLVMMDSIVLPFQMAYKNGEVPDNFDRTWLWLTTSFFLSDIMLSFQTAYPAGNRDVDVRPGKLIVDRMKIANSYIRSWFAIDLVSTIPISFVADQLIGGNEKPGSGKAVQVAQLTKVLKLIRFLRLMRMLRLAKLSTIWERVEAQLGSIAMFQFFALLRVMFVLTLICHWNACVWWMLGQEESLLTELFTAEGVAHWRSIPHWTTIPRNAAGSPVDEFSSTSWKWSDQPVEDAYTFCFYWTLGVMRTMPAEVQPINKPERVYVMLFMFFAFSAFAICIAQITQTFFKFSERKRIFNDELAALRAHLRKIRAGEALQNRVKSYCQHVFERRRIHAKESSLVHHLPLVTRQLLKRAQLVPVLMKAKAIQCLPSQARLLVADMAQIKDVIAGHVMCQAGETSYGAWFLVTGRLVKLERVSERFQRQGSAGDEYFEVVDENCLINAEPYQSESTVAAAVASETIWVDRDLFFRHLSALPELLLPTYSNTPSGTRDSQRSGGTVASQAAQESHNLQVAAQKNQDLAAAQSVAAFMAT